MALLARHPQLHMVGLDLPRVTEVFAARAARLGFGQRSESLAGDMHRVELEAESFDLIVVANVLHLEPGPRAASLLQRLAPALRPGGELVVVDAFDPDGVSPCTVALYALQLSMRVASGQVHTAQQVHDWLTNAGLGDVASISLGDSVIGAVRGRRR
jgi:SAM-dependent methyltransferase